MDNLSYAYRTNSNKLLSVTDATTSIKGFEDGNKSGNDYDYDTNGNLIKDLNKGITKISYNHLNLPTEVLWSSTKKINYSYDASGVKLRKTVTDGSTVSTTDYLGGFQYKNNILQFYPTSEGYVNVTNGNVFNYVYNYTDHLGNVRLSYQKENDGSLKVLEENNYYPFGLKHEGYNSTILANQNYKYKYNGKELQEELGLNWTAMDFRNYDASIGRFISSDKLSEFVPMYTPYRFGLNNPVYWNDPTGLIEFTYDKNGNTTGYSTNDQNEIQAIMQFLGSNEKASTSDIENFVWTDMDSNENSVFSLDLGEVSVKSSPDYAKMLRKTSGYLFKLNQPFEEGFKRATTYTEIPSPWARTMVYYEKTIPKWIPQIGGTKLRSPSILVNSNKVGKIAKGLKVGGVALGAAGAVLGAVDIYENGLNISNGLDTTMSILAATPTGWTQAIAGTYFLTNFIVTATTGQDIGQHIESMINEN